MTMTPESKARLSKAIGQQRRSLREARVRAQAQLANIDHALAQTKANHERFVGPLPEGA